MYELVYTSAPRGLQPGSSGFTTVAYTRDMPPPYVHVCESLSGYVHHFPLNSAQYALNPVAYSHVCLDILGKTFHILSRVASYGADYTGRTNKLAHHVMIEAGTLCLPGSAWLMSRPGFFLETWDRPACLLPPNRIAIPADAGIDYHARTWEKVMGDAAGAALLARHLLDRPDENAVLVFSPGMEVLPMFAEAQVLLPPAKRWQATFTTYYLDRLMERRWLGLLRGADDWRKITRKSGALVFLLDEKQILGDPLEDRNLIACARSGTRPEQGIESREQGAGRDDRPCRTETRYASEQEQEQEQQQAREIVDEVLESEQDPVAQNSCQAVVAEKIEPPSLPVVAADVDIAESGGRRYAWASWLVYVVLLLTGLGSLLFLLNRWPEVFPTAGPSLEDDVYAVTVVTNNLPMPVMPTNRRVQVTFWFPAEHDGAWSHDLASDPRQADCQLYDLNGVRVPFRYTRSSASVMPGESADCIRMVCGKMTIGEVRDSRITIPHPDRIRLPDRMAALGGLRWRTARETRLLWRAPLMLAPADFQPVPQGGWCIDLRWRDSLVFAELLAGFDSAVLRCEITFTDYDGQKHKETLRCIGIEHCVIALRSDRALSRLDEVDKAGWTRYIHTVQGMAWGEEANVTPLLPERAEVYVEPELRPVMVWE